VKRSNQQPIMQHDADRSTILRSVANAYAAVRAGFRRGKKSAVFPAHGGTPGSDQVGAGAPQGKLLAAHAPAARGAVSRYEEGAPCSEEIACWQDLLASGAVASSGGREVLGACFQQTPAEPLSPLLANAVKGGFNINYFGQPKPRTPIKERPDCDGTLLGRKLARIDWKARAETHQLEVEQHKV